MAVPTNTAKYVTEFTGTFFLVLAIALTGNAFVIGATLAALVYVGGHISGGHYNPAVTLGVYLRKKIHAHDALIYVSVQLLAAVVAAAAYEILKGQGVLLTVAPGVGVSFATALLAEVIFTFLLVSTVLHTATSERANGNQYYGLAIGISLMVGVASAGAISGGAFNPAVGIGANLYDISTVGEHLSNLVLYSVGPLLGSIVAFLLFRVTSAER
jgi:aquaporin Z